MSKRIGLLPINFKISTQKENWFKGKIFSYCRRQNVFNKDLVSGDNRPHAAESWYTPDAHLDKKQLILTPSPCCIPRVWIRKHICMCLYIYSICVCWYVCIIFFFFLLVCTLKGLVVSNIFQMTTYSSVDHTIFLSELWFLVIKAFKQHYIYYLISFQAFQTQKTHALQ